MLPKHKRLDKHLFDQVFSDAQTIRGRSCYIKYSDLKMESTRVSVVVSKKVARRAVARNRLRRKGYQALAQLHPHIRSGLGLIVFVNNPNITTDELAHECRGLLKRAGLLAPGSTLT